MNVTKPSSKPNIEHKSKHNNEDEEEITDDKKQEPDNDSEYEGFEREEIAELAEEERSKDAQNKKNPASRGAKSKSDKIDSDYDDSEGDDEEDYDDYVDTTPEAIATKGEDQDLTNNRDEKSGIPLSVLNFNNDNKNYKYCPITSLFTNFCKITKVTTKVKTCQSKEINGNGAMVKTKT